jgi:hypothetical protein
MSSVAAPGLAPTVWADDIDTHLMPRDDPMVAVGSIPAPSGACSFVTPCLIGLENGDWVVDSGAPDIVHIVRRDDD